MLMSQQLRRSLKLSNLQKQLPDLKLQHPGSKKGKLDKDGIWLVTIKMPKKLIADIYSGTKQINDVDTEGATPQGQPADATAMADPTAVPALDAAAPAAPTEPAI